MACAGSANKMTASLKARTVIAFFFAAALSFAAAAQPPAPNTTEWENESLKLRLFYPSDLVKRDTEQGMHDGQLALFGVSDPKLAAATHCLHPALVLNLPSSNGTQPPAATATILLAELDVNCLNAEHASASTTLLNDMAEIVNKVPGMKSIAQPATYTIGWQKVHMAAAQGQPDGSSQLYTMGISTNWNSHLLVWYFSSNSIDTLNRITKTTVRFGRDQAAPLYPLSIGNATP
jgi:hypothetical protein